MVRIGTYWTAWTAYSSRPATRDASQGGAKLVRIVLVADEGVEDQPVQCRNHGWSGRLADALGCGGDEVISRLHESPLQVRVRHQEQVVDALGRSASSRTAGYMAHAVLVT